MGCTQSIRGKRRQGKQHQHWQIREEKGDGERKTVLGERTCEAGHEPSRDKKRKKHPGRTKKKREKGRSTKQRCPLTRVRGLRKID